MTKKRNCLDSAKIIISVIFIRNYPLYRDMLCFIQTRGDFLNIHLVKRRSLKIRYSTMQEEKKTYGTVLGLKE